MVCPVQPCAESTCGNNEVDAGEECDDGNTASFDGCSSQCKSEGWLVGCMMTNKPTMQSMILNNAVGQ